MFGNAIALWFVFLVLICLGAGALGGFIVLRTTKSRELSHPVRSENED